MLFNDIIILFQSLKNYKRDTMLDYRSGLILKVLALRGCLDNYVVVRTSELARELGKSQQSASVYLIRLEKGDLIHRTYCQRASKIKITEEGRKILLAEFQDYKGIFYGQADKKIMRLTGVVVKGLGEGGYYISLPHYQNQIMEKLGFVPYSGTLNLKIDQDSIPELERLCLMNSIKITGFEDKGRTFGEVDCYRCKIDGEEGAIIIPERTHYSDRVEVISPWYLREKLNKGESDRVLVEIE